MAIIYLDGSDMRSIITIPIELYDGLELGLVVMSDGAYLRLKAISDSPARQKRAFFIDVLSDISNRCRQEIDQFSVKFARRSFAAISEGKLSRETSNELIGARYEKRYVAIGDSYGDTLTAVSIADISVERIGNLDDTDESFSIVNSIVCGRAKGYI